MSSVRFGARAAGAALVAWCSAGADAQTRAASWSFTPASELRWIGRDAEHVLVLSEDRVERRRLDDGTLVAEQALVGCGASFVASRGELLARFDPVEAAGPGGLIVSCYGGTGQAPVHAVMAIDPGSLAVRWRVDGGARALSPIAERDGRVIAEWEEPRSDAGVMAIDAASGAVLWTVTVPRGAHEGTDLFASDGVVVQVSSRGAVHALAADDGRTLWTAAESGPRFVSFRARVLITAHDERLIARAGADGRELWRWEAPAHVGSFVAARDDLVLVETAEIGGGPVATVHAIDRASGAVRWTSPLGPHPLVVTAGDHAFVANDAEVEAIALGSGAIVRRWPATHTVLMSASADAVLGLEFVGREGVTALQPARVARFEITSGNVWRSRARVMGGAPLIEDGGVVAVCTGGGSVQTLEAASGATRWRGAIGLLEEWPGDACRLTMVGGRLVALGARNRVSVYELAGAGRAGARVMVRGRVVGAGAGAGIRVLVGEAWTRTDADGRFEREVQSAGPITVQIELGDQQRHCAHAEPVEITVGAARRREVTVRLVRDHCACNPCD